MNWSRHKEALIVFCGICGSMVLGLILGVWGFLFGILFGIAITIYALMKSSVIQSILTGAYHNESNIQEKRKEIKPTVKFE